MKDFVKNSGSSLLSIYRFMKLKMRYTLMEAEGSGQESFQKITKLDAENTYPL